MDCEVSRLSFFLLLFGFSTAVQAGVLGVAQTSKKKKLRAKQTAEVREF